MHGRAQWHAHLIKKEEEVTVRKICKSTLTRLERRASACLTKLKRHGPPNTLLPGWTEGLRVQLGPKSSVLTGTTTNAQCLAGGGGVGGGG